MTVSLDLRSIARALGGEVSGKQVLAPGPNHSRGDRSLSVRLSHQSPTGFIVTSFAGDPFDVCRDFVSQKLGIDPDAWRTRSRGRGESRPAPTFTVPEVDEGDDEARIARAVEIWQQARDPAGTVVERYLAGRGLALPERAVDVLRFQARRGEIAVAALTIMRAYVLAGRPGRQTPLGSFEGWSRAVRDALIWAGSADPLGTMEEARKSDPVVTQLGDVITQWAKVIGFDRLPTSQVIARATKKSEFGDHGFLHHDFREALLIVAGEGGNVSSQRLGTWLGRMKDKPVNGYAITKLSETGGSGVWQLTKEHRHD